MLAGIMTSALTLRKDTLEKVAFILLNVVDLGLTVFAHAAGAQEINPLVRGMLDSQYQLLLVKLVIPVTLAWLIPGKLLIPGIAVLAFVVGWNVRELVLLMG
jgi:hypothetical protein